MNESRQELREQIIQMLVRYDVFQSDMAQDLEVILGDFEIGARKTELMVINEDENEMIIRKFITAKIVKGLTQRTLKAYKETLDTFLLKMQKNIADITSDDIRLYIARRLRVDKVSDVTAGNELRNLRSFFNWAYTEEMIRRNPIAKVEPIKKRKTKKDAFTELEVEMIRSSCQTNMETAIIEVLLSTGCRVGELVGIKREELTGDSLIVHGKGKKDRTVYLNAKTQLALQRYLAERKDNIPYLFPKGVNFGQSEKIRKVRMNWYKYPELIVNEQRDVSSIGSTVRDIGKRAGVKNVHPHRFRRTCATFALRRGMPIEQVSKMLGHEQISTTQIYLDIAEEDLKQAHKKYVI